MADPSLLDEHATAHSAPQWFIEPWIASPADLVVYEYGVRLDTPSVAVAARQIEMSRSLRSDLLACIRQVHGEMNRWVLHQAGPEAQRLQAELDTLEDQIRAAKTTSSNEDMQHLVPQRNNVSASLLALLRPVRAAHRDVMRTMFFGRLGRNAAAETYQLRCRAVDAGLGWATANQVLDASLLAYQRSMTQGRAPREHEAQGRDQDSLHLQFTVKGGLSIESLLAGGSQELRLRSPESAARRAYGQFSFRLGLARDGVDAQGSWQYHRELPAGAHAVAARLVRRRFADQHRWALQLVLRLREPIRLDHDVAGPVAAIHFGWTRLGDGRRVATIASGPDATDVRTVMLPTSIDADLERAAQYQARRTNAKGELLPKVLAELGHLRDPGSLLHEELDAMASMPPTLIPARRLYRLQEILRSEARQLPWFDAWVAQDRKDWQAAVGLARGARGRRRDFYRCEALRLARDHRAIVLEPLNLRAAGAARSGTTGAWSDFTRHARAGRLSAALHEFQQAIRWACARSQTPVFELSGPTASTCAQCGTLTEPVKGAPPRELRCHACGAESDRAANAARCVWRMAQQGMPARIQGYAQLVGGAGEARLSTLMARQAARQSKRAC